MKDDESKQLLDKKAYFRLSREQGLPNRCPILSRCVRRSHTFELVRNIENGSYQIDEPDEPIVPIVGEDSYSIRGNHNFIIGGVCPEVALFDSLRFFPGFSGYATTTAQYDKYMDPQDQVLETGHFSECAEYALDAYQAKNRERASEHDRSPVMTNTTYNIGTVQGGAVSLGGNAHNSGLFELQQYPEPIRQKIRAELDDIERAVTKTSADNSEKEKAFAKIADVKADPSPSNIRDLVDGLKAAGEIGTSVMAFVTALSRLIGLS